MVCLCEMDDDAKRNSTKLVIFFCVFKHLVLNASRKLYIQQIVYASEEHTVL